MFGTLQFAYYVDYLPTGTGISLLVRPFPTRSSGQLRQQQAYRARQRVSIKSQFIGYPMLATPEYGNTLLRRPIYQHNKQDLRIQYRSVSHFTIIPGANQGGPAPIEFKSGVVLTLQTNQARVSYQRARSYVTSTTFTKQFRIFGSPPPVTPGDIKEEVAYFIIRIR